MPGPYHKPQLSKIGRSVMSFKGNPPGNPGMNDLSTSNGSGGYPKSMGSLMKIIPEAEERAHTDNVKPKYRNAIASTLSPGGGVTRDPDGGDVERSGFGGARYMDTDKAGS